MYNTILKIVMKKRFQGCASPRAIEGHPQNPWFVVRFIFSTGARGALAPAIFEHFSTVGKNFGC
jgi:hypothetical protein